MFLIPKYLKQESGRWVSCGKVHSSATCHSVNGLNSGKSYKFRVRAVNKEGPSDYLESWKPLKAKNSFTTPEAIRNLNVSTWDRNSIKLRWAIIFSCLKSASMTWNYSFSWDMPRNDGGTPITHFIVEQKGKFDILFSKVLQTNNKEIIIGNLLEGHKYQFRVKAANEVGDGSPSQPTDWYICKYKSE